jgi:putative aldouronate transport system substrate-binding protein
MIAKAYMPFIYSDQYYGLALYDKKVTEQYRLEEFREALRYLNSLFREGLILEDSFTMTRDQLQTLGENPGAPVLGVALVEMSNHPVIQGSERWFDFFLLPVLQGPSGQQNGPNKDPWSILSPGMFVTDKCSRPDLAVALYDYFLNPEIMLTGNIGQKGVAWDDPDSGALSILGTPALYKSLGSGKLLNATWDQQNPMIRSNSFRLGTQANDVETALSFIKTGDPALKARLLKNPSYNEVANYHMAMTHVPYGIPAKYFIPPLVLNDDDNTRIADINAVLNSYKEQTMVEFITGKRSLDEGWASYLAELNHLGSGELAAIIQKYIK